MRQFYQEKDLISAEVQNVMVSPPSPPPSLPPFCLTILHCSPCLKSSVVIGKAIERQLFTPTPPSPPPSVLQSDGTVHLHTRTVRYGKLENGLLVYVRPSLVRRSKHHFITLPRQGVDVILGTFPPTPPTLPPALPLVLVYVRPSLVRRSKRHFITLPRQGLDVILGTCPRFLPPSLPPSFRCEERQAPFYHPVSTGCGCHSRYVSSLPPLPPSSLPPSSFVSIIYPNHSPLPPFLPPSLPDRQQRLRLDLPVPFPFRGGREGGRGGRKGGGATDGEGRGQF